MEKLITVEESGATLRFRVWDQEWTEAAFEELRREHNVLFRADSVVPVLIRGKILTLGIEDDGVLIFGPEAPSFHVHWAPALAETLTEAIEQLAPPVQAEEP